MTSLAFWKTIPENKRNEILHSLTPILSISVKTHCFQTAFITYQVVKMKQRFSDAEIKLSVKHKKHAAIAHAKHYFFHLITNDTLVILQ